MVIPLSIIGDGMLKMMVGRITVNVAMDMLIHYINNHMQILIGDLEDYGKP